MVSFPSLERNKHIYQLPMFLESWRDCTTIYHISLKMTQQYSYIPPLYPRHINRNILRSMLKNVDVFGNVQDKCPFLYIL